MTASRIYKTEGIVIKRRNIGETDKTLSVFTKEFGKINVLAKGVRRITSRRSGHLELFSHVILTIYRGRNTEIITEATRLPQQLDSTGQKNLKQVMYSYYLCELVDKLTPEGQKHEDVFSLLVTSLKEFTISDTDDQSKARLNLFSLQLLRFLGFLPTSVSLVDASIISFIEQIIERKLRTPALLTGFHATE